MPTRLGTSALVVSLALAACDGGGSTAPAEPLHAAGAATIAIQGWPSGATGKLRFYRNATVDNVLLETPVSADGVVRYALPAPAGLMAYAPAAGVVVDPPDARFQIVANITMALDPSETHTAEVRLGNRLVHPSPQAGDTLAQLWYADRLTTVTGAADGCTYQQRFEPGWNYALLHVVALEPYTCVHSAAPALQPGLGWHYIYLGP